MRLLNSETRRLLPAAIFWVALAFLVSFWIILRFVLGDAQYRALDPQHYTIQVVTAADYGRLADPANRVVQLSDGHTIHKALIWDEVVLPNYKLTDDGRYYVLVTTKGTAHILPYVEGELIFFGFIVACGLFVSLWNLRLDKKVSGTFLSISDHQNGS